MNVSLTDFARSRELSHREALLAAEREGLVIGEYGSEVDKAKVGITAEWAEEVARDDVSLVYIVVPE